MANLYVISGCNGAGKTTASYSVLPDMINCKEFVNADEIAKGLSPIQSHPFRLLQKELKQKILRLIIKSFTIKS